MNWLIELYIGIQVVGVIVFAIIMICGSSSDSGSSSTYTTHSGYSGIGARWINGPCSHSSGATQHQSGGCYYCNSCGKPM